ncbi:MAG: aminotransferase class I/II-fold pyridoxal phosphate-dependent enzyme, partial [Rhodospirillaceae bacterium]
MSKLALFGGTPVIGEPLEPFNRIGEAERAAVLEVVESGVLSGYVGAPGPEFNGGPQVQNLEARWADRFAIKHAVAVNSATSGLFAAMGASGIGPGDEVIVPPYTFAATANSVALTGATPVFADIEPRFFCLDPDAVRAAITPRTAAIMPVHLYGHPANMTEIMAIAQDHGLMVFEDAAQAHAAMVDGVAVGSFGTFA